MGKEQYRRRNGLDLERAILSEEMGSSEETGRIEETGVSDEVSGVFSVSPQDAKERASASVIRDARSFFIIIFLSKICYIILLNY